MRLLQRTITDDSTAVKVQLIGGKGTFLLWVDRFCEEPQATMRWENRFEGTGDLRREATYNYYFPLPLIKANATRGGKGRIVEVR
jgi:hypothetical protein